MSRYDDYVASLPAIAYWKLNELSGSHAQDFVAGTYNASYSTNLVRKGEPPIQKAEYARSVYFEGTSNSQIGVGAAGIATQLAPTTGFTWIVTAQPNTNSGSNHALFAVSSAFTMRVNHGAGGSIVPVVGIIPVGGGGQINCSGPAIASGAVFHYAGQFAPSGFAGGAGFISCFVNGSLGGSRAASIMGDGIASGQFFIGGGGAFSVNWKGWAQNFVAVPTVLSAQAISDLAAIALTDPAPNLLVHLTSPQGSVYPLSSHIRAEPGPDFGLSGLFQSNIAANPAVEGGQLAYDSVGPRRFTFPLRIPSSGILGGLESYEQQLRQAADLGGYLSIGPTNMASSDWIRWDILAGRVSHDGFNVFMQNQLTRRDVTLEIDAQPLGYLPTSMVISSTASMGITGNLPIPGTALLGDVPGLARLNISPTVASAYVSLAQTDAVMWSLRGKPSALAFWSAANFAANVGVGSLAGDAFAPASQSFVVTDIVEGGAWSEIADVSIPSSLEPAYRTRYRAFAFMRLTPSQGFPWKVSLDAVNDSFVSALGSAAPIATLAPAVASGNPGAFGAQASPAQTVVDLGEISLPVAASGLQVNQVLRFWMKAATTTLPTTQVHFGGLFLQALPNAGILSRGLVVPSVNAAAYIAARFRSDRIGNFNSILMMTSGDAPLLDADRYYRGQLPIVSATTTALDILFAERRSDLTATEPMMRGGPNFAAVNISYRPRFTFVKGL